MSASAPRLVIAEAGVAPVARALFAALEVEILPHNALRPETPFAGALFEWLERLTAGDVFGLVVPGVWRAVAARPGSPAVVVVRDHVNLVLRGPLTGRWPTGGPRSFPCMTGIYQPSAARAAASAPVYSEDVVAAGVHDAARLTPFERRALAEAGAAAHADCLVPAVIAAAFYDLKVAACLVTQAAHERE